VSHVSLEHDLASPRASRSELMTRYRAYRLRQARALLHMVPREAIRPLYRKAVREGFGADGSDPMAALVRYCERLLPLPPFEVWRDDVRENPTAYVDDADDSAVTPTAEAPLTQASRELAHDDRRWTAHLRSFRDGSVWSGFIAFEESLTNSVHRTAVIFREPDAESVRERFANFESSTLVSFLRSALP